jgi:hypothetical protein
LARSRLCPHSCGSYSSTKCKPDEGCTCSLLCPCTCQHCHRIPVQLGICVACQQRPISRSYRSAQRCHDCYRVSGTGEGALRQCQTPNCPNKAPVRGRTGIFCPSCRESNARAVKCEFNTCTKNRLSHCRWCSIDCYVASCTASGETLLACVSKDKDGKLCGKTVLLGRGTRCSAHKQDAQDKWARQKAKKAEEAKKAAGN